MRFQAKSKSRFRSREAASKAGKRSQQVQSQRRIAAACGEGPLRRPDEGTVIRIITVEDCIAKTSVRIVVRQARRKNQVVPSVFGRRGNPVGWDRIMRRLREVCVCRWIEE